MSIALYNKNNIDSLTWPETIEAEMAKNFLVPLIKEGTEAFIKNVKTDLNILKVEDFIIPITINEQEYTNSYVASLYCLVGLLEEKIDKTRKWSNPLLKTAIKSCSPFLKLLKINKVVMVNNWLFATTINPAFSHSQVKAMTDFLAQVFPEHMIVFRSVNSYLDKELLGSLKELGYQLMGTREVYLFNPDEHPVFSKRDCKRDVRLLKESGYEVIDAEQFNNEDALRALELYKSLYVDKYTKFSPQFTEKFVKLLLDSHFLQIKGLKKEGKLDGVTGFLKIYHKMIIPFFGYDTSQSQELGLYRIVNILGLLEAEHTHFILNQSSGAKEFKKVRGLMPYKEYQAIYVSHLEGCRRHFWKTFDLFSSKFLLPILEKFNL